MERRAKPYQQTFSAEHWDAVFGEFAGGLSTDTMGVLYRASYSTTFGADLRALLREIVREHVVEEWERG